MHFKGVRTDSFRLASLGFSVEVATVMSGTFRSLFLVLLSLLAAWAQTEMKRVVGDNATLPCHHQFWGPESQTLDIEWLLQKPNSKQRVVITYFGGKVYDPNENQQSRLSFAGDYLKGDASLLIGDLMLTDSGEYSCKVKTGGKYHWSTVDLIVLVKPSKPRCWMEGRLLEGSSVKLSCKSADGSDPIQYRWDRVLDKGKSVGKLPAQARIDLKNPEIVTLQNLTQESSGVYRCTASNDVGEENCLIEVTMHYVRGIGVVAGAVVGVSFGVILIILIVWLVFRKKEKKKYEEDETANEIREDAEAPKAKLVKPNSLSSSRSGSSRSGASSTQSMVHNSAPRGHRPRPPAVTALKENGQPPSFPQSPPAYAQVVPKTPEPSTPKLSPGNLTRMGATPVMIPAQSKAFQTV
ncbi:CXADR-like membrane protein isoform X1 [Anguilla rostrata]|uniref:CXADR-like membrane protein isoform X1 n=1 Tax=Anguilla rostrata TaxID=7938 RepID=UPI0030CED362